MKFLNNPAKVFLAFFAICTIVIIIMIAVVDTIASRKAEEYRANQERLDSIKNYQDSILITSLLKEMAKEEQRELLRLEDSLKTLLSKQDGTIIQHNYEITNIKATYIDSSDVATLRKLRELIDEVRLNAAYKD